MIPLADNGKPIPLSFAQERLWFLDQMEPGSVAYNVPLAIRLRGDLDVPALRQSLQAILQRHAVLRTRFASHQGDPVQIVEDATLELLQDDLTNLDVEQREAELKARLDKEALQPFDLTRGPLLRCRLFVLSSDDQVLMLSMHHVVSDGWSQGVFFRELAALYTAFCRERPESIAGTCAAVCRFRGVAAPALERGTAAGPVKLLEAATRRHRNAAVTY